MNAARAERFTAVGLVTSALPAGLVVAKLDPRTTPIFPPCPFHAVTGLWCPGCGVTRALHDLAQGDVASAFGMNPLAVLLLPVAVVALVQLASFAWTGRWPASRPAGRWTGWAVLGTVIAFTVLRNLPMPAVAWMAP